MALVSLTRNVLLPDVPGAQSAPVWLLFLLGVVTALLASILAHEVAHACDKLEAARSRRSRLHLWRVAQIAEEPKSRSRVADGFGGARGQPAPRRPCLPRLGSASTATWWLTSRWSICRHQLLRWGVQPLPGFPLDGRVLHSVLWAGGDNARATHGRLDRARSLDGYGRGCPPRDRRRGGSSAQPRRLVHRVACGGLVPTAARQVETVRIADRRLHIPSMSMAISRLRTCARAHARAQQVSSDGRWHSRHRVAGR
jgi:hypothetical protein